MIAALYIDPRGPYPTIPGVDCWDETRDARLYDGPYPVVAHPPCGPWGRLKHLYRGNEHDMAPRALEQVRKFGGVLEHPAESKFFVQFLDGHIGRFGSHLDSFGGWCLSIDQVNWGHCARKRTWLYAVGVPLSAFEPAPYPEAQPTHWISGFRNDGKGEHPKRDQACPPGIKICSAQQRRRTPIAFARYLVRLAEAAGANRKAA